MSGGRFYGVGIGPGDPELITLKAARLIRDLSLIHISEPTRRLRGSRMPSSA